MTDPAFLLPSPMQRSEPSWLVDSGIALYIKRDDLIHPLISGNKWRKLSPAIPALVSGKFSRLLTFGGAFSNHIHAVAAAGRIFGFPTTGIIRGEAEYAENPTLSAAREFGMALNFVDRATYRRRYDPRWLDELAKRYAGAMVLPEGGSGMQAYEGMATLARELAAESGRTECSEEHWVLPVGSGGTLAGLVAAAPPEVHIHGIAVVKDISDVARRIQSDLAIIADGETPHYVIHKEFAGAGYARFDQTLLDFMTQYWVETGIRLEPVYSGKAMYALYCLIRNKVIPRGARVVFVHTGGLQGLYGMKQRYPDKFTHEAFNI